MDPARKNNLILLRRKILSSYLTKINCTNKLPYLNLNQIDNGINMEIFGKGKSIKDSSLLIDYINKDIEKFSDISLANGFFSKTFEGKSCYLLSQNISLDFPLQNKVNMKIKARLLTKEGVSQNLYIPNQNFVVDKELNKSRFIQMENKISKVEILGKYLREGEFKNLFNLVGIMNQSDPMQNYLKNAEKIYIQRYKENNYIKDLYSILITEILQKKIIQANKTINLILELDNNNGNAYLTKSIINIYLFNAKNARFSYDKATRLERSSETEQILHIVDGLTYILEMKFINAFKIFT